MNVVNPQNRKPHLRLPKPPSALEHMLDVQLRASGLSGYEQQYRFIPSRKFMADFVWVGIKFIVEVDGGQWVSGTGHNSGTGKERDCERDAEALLAGWRVMRVSSSMVRDGRALRLIERALEVLT